MQEARGVELDEGPRRRCMTASKEGRPARPGAAQHVGVRGLVQQTQRLRAGAAPRTYTHSAHSTQLTASARHQAVAPRARPLLPLRGACLPLVRVGVEPGKAPRKQAAHLPLGCARNPRHATRTNDPLLTCTSAVAHERAPTHPPCHATRATNQAAHLHLGRGARAVRRPGRPRPVPRRQRARRRRPLPRRGQRHQRRHHRRRSACVRHRAAGARSAAKARAGQHGEHQRTQCTPLRLQRGRGAQRGRGQKGGSPPRRQAGC